MPSPNHYNRKRLILIVFFRRIFIQYIVQWLVLRRHKRLSYMLIVIFRASTDFANLYEIALIACVFVTVCRSFRGDTCRTTCHSVRFSLAKRRTRRNILDTSRLCIAILRSLHLRIAKMQGEATRTMKMKRKKSNIGDYCLSDAHFDSSKIQTQTAQRHIDEPKINSRIVQLHEANERGKNESFKTICAK